MKHDITAYLQKSHDCLEDTKILLSNKRYDGAVNRAYYAFFDGIRVLLATKDIFVKSSFGNSCKISRIFYQDRAISKKV